MQICELFAEVPKDTEKSQAFATVEFPANIKSLSSGVFA